jgi:hypothetical protein
MDLNLRRSMIAMKATEGKKTGKKTELEEDRRRRKKEIERPFWGRRRTRRLSENYDSRL